VPHCLKAGTSETLTWLPGTAAKLEAAVMSASDPARRRHPKKRPLRVPEDPDRLRSGRGLRVELIPDLQLVVPPLEAGGVCSNPFGGGQSRRVPVPLRRGSATVGARL
jgi:hypothetical protein